MATDVLPTSVWDESRIAEFRLLEELVREVVTIDSGNCCLKRIARCIEIAEQLGHLDLSDDCRQDFVSWLKEQILIDRFGPDYRNKQRSEGE